MNIEIRSDIPIPNGRENPSSELGELRSVLRRMEPGQCARIEDNGLVYRAASQIGVKITTRKLDGGGYMVWLRSREEAKG